MAYLGSFLWSCIWSRIALELLCWNLLTICFSCVWLSPSFFSDECRWNPLESGSVKVDWWRLGLWFQMAGIGVIIRNSAGISSPSLSSLALVPEVLAVLGGLVLAKSLEFRRPMSCNIWEIYPHIKEIRGHQQLLQKCSWSWITREANAVVYWFPFQAKRRIWNW